VTGSLGLMANRDILDAAGVDGSPATLEEFESALEQIKGLGNDIIPYAASTKVGDSLKDFIQWMQAFGAKVVDDGKITITDGPSVDALTWYKSMLDRGLIAPGVDRTVDARPLYAQRRVGFYDDAVVARGSLKIPADDTTLLDVTEPMTRPTVGKNPSISRSYGQVLAVLNGGDVQTGIDFASFITTDPEVVVQYLADTALPPTTTAAEKSPEVRDDPWQKAWAEKVTAHAVPDPFWQFSQFAQLESILAEQVEAALLGDVSPKESLSIAEGRMNDIIK